MKEFKGTKGEWDYKYIKSRNVFSIYKKAVNIELALRSSSNNFKPEFLVEVFQGDKKVAKRKIRTEGRGAFFLMKTIAFH